MGARRKRREPEPERMDPIDGEGWLSLGAAFNDYAEEHEHQIGMLLQFKRARAEKGAAIRIVHALHARQFAAVAILAWLLTPEATP